MISVIALWSMVSCKPVIREHALHPGELDLERYMSFGDSYSAAFLDGAISIESQLGAYPNVLAGQFQLVGGGDFLIPMMTSDSGCNWVPPDTLSLSFFNTLSKVVLKREADCHGQTRLQPRFAHTKGEPLFDASGHSSSLYVGGPLYNNMAVPGMRGNDIYIEGYGWLSFQNLAHFNPYFWRFSSDQLSASVFQDALRSPPTFFTVWFGINDLLPFALAGGNRSGFGRAKITVPEEFEASIRNFIAALCDTPVQAEGAIATVPDITAFPFFTTIQPQGLQLTAAEATTLDSLYSMYPWMHFNEGMNPFVINDPDDSIQVRQIRPDELLLLSIDPDSLLCAGWGKTKPIREIYVLDSNEIIQLQQATLVFNEVIKRYAAENGIALVDMELLFDDVNDHYIEDGVTFSFDWLFGGFFSLDGVHPTPRGQALIANHFIRAINAAYAAAIPLVEITEARGNLFP